jgi:two-component system, sensor histidine kinase
LVRRSGVGLFVTLFGAIIENIFYSATPFEFFTSQTEVIRLLVFLGQGALISFIFGEVHRAQVTIALREEQLSEALNRERQSRIEKEDLIRKLNATQEQIIAEQKKAEEANRLKSLFLAQMSHEIRTPLVSVLGFAELLKEPDLAPENARKYGGIIERTGHNLLNIINDILDLSKVEAGRLEIEKIPFSMKNLISEIHSTLHLITEQKNIHFEFIEVGKVPSIVIGDPTRLRQILLNLVGNAIKFTEQGFVKIRYQTTENELVFTIQDSGVGISPEQQQYIFESFRQGDSSISRRFAGTGLGLSLSKKLANKMGGDIKLVKSDLNQGSVFEVIVAFERPSDSLEIVDNSSSLAPTAFENARFQKDKTVLLVDDSTDNQFLVQTILSKWGLHVDLASNGKEAIEKVKKDNYDLILMDMQMPIMDGYTACARLIEDSCKVPIVALTANAMKEDRERCLQAGCKDYLSKPIHKNQLFQVLQKNLSL